MHKNKLMDDFIQSLETVFKENSNPTIASQQKAYMRNQFEFYGIKSPLRREIQKPFLVKTYLPDKKELKPLVKILWQKPQRDYHYFAQELVFKYKKQFEKQDIDLFEYMVKHNAWWDTIDFIAPTLMGHYFKQYPNEIKPNIDKWLTSDNIWLKRCCIIFQLKYKENLDTILLSDIINACLGSKEFFINKAIGWILRNYSRIDPQWVVEFVNKTNLSNLSKREALRLLK